MKRKFLIAFLLVLTFALAENTMAQTTETKPAVPEANPADVSSMYAILKAMYDVISGDAGQKRDWNRMRTLFHPAARMTATGKNPNTGVFLSRADMVEDYIKRNEPFFEKNGFFETEKARRVENFGNIAHVFSTYEAFHKKDDKTPFLRGINSIQLWNDGKRWWVMNVMWQAETPDVQLPEKYLKNEN